MSIYFYTICVSDGPDSVAGFKQFDTKSVNVFLCWYPGQIVDVVSTRIFVKKKTSDINHF